MAHACINSFGAHGHAFTLYTYGEPLDVPAFVTQKDAESLVPARDLFIAHGGVETSTEVFIYRFLDQIGGWYVDADVVCNTDVLPDVEIAFGEEKTGIINNAVLKFPKRHAAISALIQYCSSVDPVTAPWGTTGPLALSRVFSEHDLGNYKRPPSDFYPLHWTDSPKLLFPEFTAEVMATVSRAPFIHLWGAALREVGFDTDRAEPLEGSFLDLLYGRYLDRALRATLRSLDETSFRRAVKSYVETTWNVPLPLNR